MSTEADRLVSEGNRAEDAGEFERARDLYRQAVAAAPQYPKAHINLAIALESLGDTDGAYAAYQRALGIDPANPFANYNLGKLLYSRGAPLDAERTLRLALTTRPDFPEARIVLGHALHAQGRTAEAADELRAGLAGTPQDWGARAALFHILQAQGDHAGAAVQIEQVLQLRPDWVEALHNYGTTLLALKRDAEAEAALRRVVELEPGFTLAYRMLGSLLHNQGRVDELHELYRRGRAARPDDLELASFELFELNFIDRISEDAIFRAHRDFGERLQRAQPARFAHRREASERPLRIGYVSGDFNYHPVGLFLLPVLERHDRTLFQPYCYSTSTRADDFTSRVKAAAHAWREARALSERELADAVHADGIDILVDLAGHSGVARLGVFAQQPAPVQAAWLGYLNTTGLDRIQYRITDAVCDPPGLTERWHTERLVRLPHSQWCYRPFVAVDPAPGLPRERNGYVTFGSFTQTAKLTGTTLSLWARILARLPRARLLVAGVAQGRPTEALRAALAASGIALSRVTLVPYLPVREYLRQFEQVDIALDPTPYSGGTTTCDALWMGVPVVTAPAARSVSRSAASILRTVGLDECVASSRDDYIERAVGLAGCLGELAALRVSLRERMRRSPLMDEQGFVRDLERAYHEMWREWREGGR